MKKRVVLWFVISAIIMFVLPWLAVAFVKGDAGMAVCFLLFYTINPIYSVIIGAVAGKDIKHLCNLPFISSILYLFGVWIFFDMGETVFIMYAVIYLILGILAMLISMFIERKKRR